MINIQDLIEKSKYNLCHEFTPIEPVIKTRKVFSFVLFLAKPPKGQISGLPGDTKPQTVREWVVKYFVNQEKKFAQLLNDPHWSDFGIVWFIENKLLRSRIKIEEKTMKEHVEKMTKKFPGRLAVLGYVCDNISKSPWYGSIVRFVPLILGEFEVIIFRDAHSTIPNPNNRFDRDWYETWCNLKGDEFKKFWLYQMITYNPVHARGEKVPFAATWGARAVLKNSKWTPIFGKKMWNKYFGDPSRDPGVYYPDFKTGKSVERIKPGDYGVDERIFGQLIYETKFLRNAYIVGIIWTLFLFNPEANPRQFTKYVDNGDIIYCAPHSGMHSVALHTYFSEARCVIYYIAETFGDGWDTKLTDLFQIISKLQAWVPMSKRDQLLRYLIGMLPSQEHMWEFLFDTNIVNPYSGITLGETMKRFGISKLNYENLCEIAYSYFRGGEINYDRYIHEEEYKKIRPDTQKIKVPASYPHKPIRGGTSKFLGLF